MVRSPVKLIKPTHSNLDSIVVEPLIRWLISAAHARRTITYGEVKHRLETEFKFSRVFPTILGHPAGSAMDLIHKHFPDAPLLNVLLVRQDTRMPGEGAGYFLARKYNQPRLYEEDASKKYLHLWRKYFEKAVDEVYRYQGWEKVYSKLFKSNFKFDSLQTKGSEKDGHSWGGGGEGRHHRNLRLWVQANPKKIAPRLKVLRSVTEEDLLSGDRVDVVYYADNCTVGIEVKSRDSDWYDLQRGIYQCVKYEAVLRAQDPREKPKIQTVLVTETELDGELRNLIWRFGIRHQVVPDNF